jgi:hypothetical protein
VGGQRVLGQLEHVTLHRRGEALAAVIIQGFLREDTAVEADAQPLRMMIETDVEPGETGRIHQHDAIVLPRPRRVRRGGVGKPEREDPVARDPPFIEDRQGMAFLGPEALHRVAIEGDDARHLTRDEGRGWRVEGHPMRDARCGIRDSLAAIEALSRISHLVYQSVSPDLPGRRVSRLIVRPGGGELEDMASAARLDSQGLGGRALPPVARFLVAIFASVNGDSISMPPFRDEGYCHVRMHGGARFTSRGFSVRLSDGNEMRGYSPHAPLHQGPFRSF